MVSIATADPPSLNSRWRLPDWGLRGGSGGGGGHSGGAGRPAATSTVSVCVCVCVHLRVQHMINGGLLAHLVSLFCCHGKKSAQKARKETRVHVH